MLSDLKRKISELVRLERKVRVIEILERKLVKAELKTEKDCLCMENQKD